MPKISKFTAATAVGDADLLMVVQNGVTKKAAKSLINSADGDVQGPATNTANNVPQWDGENSKLLKDGLSLVTTVGATGTDTSIVTEQGIREEFDALGTSAALDVPATGDAAAGEVVKGDDTRLTDARTPVSHDNTYHSVAYGTGDVAGPGTNTADNIPQWNGADSKTLKNGLSLVTTVGATGTDTSIVTEQGIRESLNLTAPKLFNTVIASSSATLTAAQVSGTLINNYSQATANTQVLPAAAEGYNGLVVIGTEGAGAFHLKAGAGDKIYLDGTALNDGDKASLATPAIGDYFSFWSFQTGATAYDWVVTSGVGTLTDGGA